MENIQRVLNIKLPTGQSAFLWGPRKTGKSTYLKAKFPQSLVYDFLKTDVLIEFSKRPSLLREQLLAQDEKVLKNPVILDEVQKVPQILDEVHWLIENRGLRFILCGSSARKLKRGQANLLGGRAWRYEMFPFVSAELDELDLLRILNHGMIPAHYLQEDYRKSIKAYVQDYLKEEIFDEGLARNIPAFSRFFDAMTYSHGELTNYSNIARECGVDSKTVKEYYQILVDTLLGTMVEPFKKRQNRQVLTKIPKFYLFDVGVAGLITKRHLEEARGEAFGKAFEHFIFMEIAAYRSYRELDFSIRYWRTKTGLEVDFILGDGEVAVEVKGTSRVDSHDLRSLNAFGQEYAPKKLIVVCNEKEKRVVGKITILPWKMFLKRLWEGGVI
ncbi:MAG TPA: AAA family ATPase [Candidatus Omnitrophica bacterium]|nr:MAG: AAA family ATPase [Omnitrophica WOR_2 bacterium GWA2_45_18]HBR15845.1 AAA family ATPase [Candidatus Omnitrophota bacterium]